MCSSHILSAILLLVAQLDSSVMRIINPSRLGWRFESSLEEDTNKVIQMVAV